MEHVNDTSPREDTPKSETRKFKAEVKQVLDIVIHSLYTHREIFIRELVSNASDSLEKMHHASLTSEQYADKNAPFEIRIETDKNNHSVTVRDTGVGMTHDELVNNLGTVARSGTLEFIKNLPEGDTIKNEMIGKFGVGFYSAFMAAREVCVTTRSYIASEKGYEWVSDGSGQYSVREIENAPRGTSVTVLLKEDAYEFENEQTIKSTVKKYSNFVSFPIFVNGERVNTIQAVWLKSPSEVTESEYTEFYKFITNSDEDPLYKLHLSSDAPIQLSSIVYIPASNLEQFGFMKLKPSVNLYCKKILLQQHVENMMPDYLRFAAGVVDSADLSLNISRETIQDNLVFRKLGKFLAKRILKFLAEEARKDPEKYRKFWTQFGIFIKEGIVTDFDNRKELLGLFRFTSSKAKENELISFEDYAGRLAENQKSLYYLSGGSKEEIEHGPYTETFRKRNIEVIYLFDAIDDFVMTSVGEYEGKKLVSADSADIDLPELKGGEMKEESKVSSESLSKFISWVKETLGDKVSEVRESKRFIDRPAIIVNPNDGLTTSMIRIMKAAGKNFAGEGAHVLEINPAHPINVALMKLRDGKTDKGFLQLIVSQIGDNALAEAGLLDNPRIMVERMYGIIERALKSEEKNQR
jgi:molecular chaperone HtpG